MDRSKVCWNLSGFGVNAVIVAVALTTKSLPTWLAAVNAFTAGMCFADLLTLMRGGRV